MRSVLACTALGVAAVAPAVAGARPGSQEIAGEVGARIDEYLKRSVPFGFSGSVLVVVDGKPVLEQGYGPADRERGSACTPATVFDLGSLSKQFTAATVLALEQRGALETSDTLDRFLPDVPSDKRKIQIHHLLTHTSGLPRGLMTVGSRANDRDEMVRMVLGAQLGSQPGSQFLYSNLGYDLLAAIVEIASKKSFEDVVRELVFVPAGMQHTGFRCDGRIDAALAARGNPKPDEPAATGSSIGAESSRTEGGSDEKPLATEGWYSWGLRGAGGVLSTVEDLWLWNQALDGDAVLSAASRKKLFTPARDNYAYGWYVRKSNRGTKWIEHGGTTDNGFDVRYARFPDERALVVLLGNVSGIVAWMEEDVVQLAFGKSVDLPPRVIALDEEQLGRWAAEYAGAKEARCRVTADKERMLLEARSESAFAFLRGESAGREQPQLLARSREIVAGFAGSDFAALHRAEDRNRPLFYMESWWRSLVERHGALREAIVLGAAKDERGDVEVSVILDFERGSEVMRLQWSGDTLSGTNIGPPYPSRIVLVPESPTSAVAYDLRQNRVAARAVLTPAGGLELEVAGKKLKLARKP